MKMMNMRAFGWVPTNAKSFSQDAHQSATRHKHHQCYKCNTFWVINAVLEYPITYVWNKTWWTLPQPTQSTWSNIQHLLICVHLHLSTDYKVWRSGMRQSGAMVMSGISITSLIQVKMKKKRIASDYSEASESLYKTDSVVGDEDDGPKLGGRGNLSVKDAISLFEVKRRVLWIQLRQGYQSKGAARIPLIMWVH